MQFSEMRDLLIQHFTIIIEDATHLFEVNLDKDELWNLYLNSFPEGTNQIYRKRREYDCSCCHSFVRNLGNVVVIKDNKIHTIWDFDTNDTTFQPVLSALSNFVKTKAVNNVFVSKFTKIGTKFTYENTSDGKVKCWDHFFLELPNRFVDKTSKSVGDIQGTYRDVRNVFKRSLDEITKDSVLTVLELISQNSLYRGEEWKAALSQFLEYKNEYDSTPDDEKNNFTWEKSVQVGGVIGKIRNHSIGTLLVNISENMDLDKAVTKYEAIMAPANYKRPKVIFTKKMLDDAQKTLTELGYLSSLSRRFATLDDITVNNILFLNKDLAKKITGALDLFESLKKEVTVNPKNFSKVEEITIDNFIKKVLPLTQELEVFLDNKASSKMVSLIAPQDKDSKTMFKWDNNFSWAYTGNIADSDITQRVKAAGGRTDGVLRFSHSWNYEDMRNESLMDLHVFMPGSDQKVVYKNGKEIHDNYGNNERVGWNHRRHYASGGSQDVDYTLRAPLGYIPVENTTFPSIGKLKEGIYTFKIHNWSFRKPTLGGFKAEIAFGGEVYSFVYKEPLQNKEWITLAKLELKDGQFKIIEMMGNTNDSTPIDVWGLKTNQFVPVSVLMMSPNYWDEQKGNGNKHFFFMLKNCVNPDSPNGMFNEYLKEDLLKHKRVFEALGAKTAVEHTENQLSGIGFSSTQRAELIVKVKGSTERLLKIKF